MAWSPATRPATYWAVRTAGRGFCGISEDCAQRRNARGDLAQWRVRVAWLAALGRLAPVGAAVGRECRCPHSGGAASAKADKASLMPHIESLDDANLEGSVTVDSPMLAKR